MPHSHLHVEEIGARSVLVAQEGPPPTSYTLNPYIGCGLGCTCCYVTKFPHARAKLWGRSVFVDSATDPYQYVERQYRLTRRCLKVLAECNLRQITVQTRRHLILEDLDQLRSFGERLSVGFSVPTDDDRIRKKLEPHAPRIALRLRTMRTLKEAGVRVMAAVAPVLYCDPSRFARFLRWAADEVYFVPMNYLDRTGIRDLPQVTAYFESTDYQVLVGRLEQSLADVGL